MLDHTQSHSSAILRKGVFAAALLLRSLYNVHAADADAIAANDLPALTAHVGQTIELKGTPVSAGRSPSGGIIFLNFDRKSKSAITVVFFTGGSNAGAVKSEEELKPFVGKPVSIKGEVSDFKGSVQLVLKSLDEIHVVEDAPAAK